MWVHAECDKISSRNLKVSQSCFKFFSLCNIHVLFTSLVDIICCFLYFQELSTSDYYCPECRARFNFELSDSDNMNSKAK